MMHAGTSRLGRRAAAAFVALAGFLLPAASGAADLNGFLRGKGHGDVALSYTSESYDRFWAGTTRVEVPNDGSVDTESLSLWLAYGISDRLTFVANLPYVKAKSDGFDMEESGLQDISLLGQYRLAKGGTNVRQALIGAGGLRTIASNYEPNQPVDLGDGTADWLLRLVYQVQYRAFYFSQQVGFDRRSGDAPDGYPFYTEIGATWGPVTVTGTYSVLKARGGTDIGDPGFTFPSNKEEYERAGARIYARVTRSFGLSGAVFTTLDGRNTGDTSGASAGINVHF